MARVIGEFPVVERVSTGLYGVDRAMRGGIPLRGIYEVYGHEYVGKSTFSYYLAGVVAQELSNKLEKETEVSLCDIEGFDPEYVQECTDAAGFDGVVRIIDSVTNKGKMIPHEDMMQEMIERVEKKETVTCGVLDSVGAITPIMETKGDISDAFVGARAKVVAKFARKANWALNNKPTPGIIIAVNHISSIIGGVGTQSVGGKELKYLAKGRIHLWSGGMVKIQSKDEIIGYEIKGKIDKLKFGGKGGKFTIVNLPGMGINRDLSNMFTAFDWGLAERGTTVTVDGLSLGRISTLFEAARNGDHEKFTPIYDTLREHSLGFEDSSIPEDGEDSESEVDGEMDEIQEQEYME